MVFIQKYMVVIFFVELSQMKSKKEKALKKLEMQIIFCMESMKNNEEFSKNLKKYTKTHRAEKNEYNPDKYLRLENAAERYYKEIYDPHGSTVLPERNFSADPNNKKTYADKIKNFNKEMAKYNDCGADGKKKNGQYEGFHTDKKYMLKKK